MYWKRIFMISGIVKGTRLLEEVLIKRKDLFPSSVKAAEGMMILRKEKENTVRFDIAIIT